ncbi:MAG TPA: protein-glutamate O-methyltransferase CheR [Longimicrobiaceae bacterium]
MIKDDDPELEQLKRKIQRERGFNCHLYKDKCLRRRIAVRMRARGESTYAGYAALLDRDAVEYEQLLDALTINVTKFFRNQEMWAVLEEEVIPRLFEGAPEPRRIWSAGCASGEEIFSASILLHEWAARFGRTAELERFDLLGTDIDRRSLDAARRGSFPELSMGEMPAAYRERWFSPGPPYQLDARIQERVRFEHRDLISGEPEREQHLILCRNVIIYFDRGIQEKIFDRFYEALVPGGFLVLGKVETLLGRTRSLLRPVSNRQRIFWKPE